VRHTTDIPCAKSSATRLVPTSNEGPTTLRVAQQFPVVTFTLDSSRSAESLTSPAEEM